jgi:DNA-binding response OmpR family regulator
MITARAEPGDELDGVVAGAAAYLTKPFRTALLRALLHKLCPPSSIVSGRAGLGRT